MDVSNYSGEPTYEALRSVVYSQNIGKLVIACQFPATFQPWHDVARDLMNERGIPLKVIEAYQELYNDDRGSYADQARAGLATIANSSAARLWLAAENGAPLGASGESPSDLVTALDALQFPTGVYTGAWYWPAMKGLQLGNRCPLWQAAYTTEAGIPAGLAVSFGGWLSARGWQYMGDFNSYGLQFDLSVWDE